MSATPPAELDRLQGFLANAFRLPDAIPEDDALGPRVAEHITGNDRLSPAEQADIYRRQFFLRHVEALAEDHAGLVHFLGEDSFDAFARAYLAKHPPRTPSLRDLGADIASFAATGEAIPEPLRDLCTEMARYELTFIELFDAPDVAPPDAQRLAALPQEAWLTGKLLFTPHLRLFELSYPVPELRKAIKNGDGANVPPPREPVYYGVFRRDDMISYERLSAEAYQLLRLLTGGEPLASACETLSRSLTDDAAAKVEAEVGTWFSRWAAWGWILDVEQP